MLTRTNGNGGHEADAVRAAATGAGTGEGTPPVCAPTPRWGHRCGNFSEEEWRAIPGWETSYEVSSLGRVRGLRRPLATGRWWASRIKKTSNNHGYMWVQLSRYGVDKWFPVHRLVLEAFNGLPLIAHPQTRHLNGIRDDNRPENLSWGSAYANARDRDAHGTTARGERQHLAKLSPEKVQAIRRRRADGVVIVAIANEFGVSFTTIQNILSGRTWRHVVW